MNLSDWIKATTLVTQHKQEAATAEMDQLSSMPLSQIAMDDSGPPIVQYGTHVPVAVTTPTGTDVHRHSSQQEDSYQQIIPGIPQGSLYPTLSSLSSGAVASNDEAQSLHDKVSKGLNKYLQDAEQCRALEDNYFNDTTRPTSIELMSEAAEQTNKSSEYNLSTAKQESMEEVELAANILESLKIEPAALYDVHHSLAQIQIKSINKARHQNMLNKMQMHIRRTMNIQPKILQESSLQVIQTSYLQHFFQLLMLLHQQKR